MEMFYTLAHRTYDTYRGVKRHSYHLMERDDAVQEAVLACYQVTTQFNPDGGGAYTYFRTVIKHTYRMLNAKAGRARRSPGTPIFDIDTVDDPVDCQRVEFLRLKSERRQAGIKPRIKDWEVAAIKDRLATGETGAALAKEFGISTSTVSRIKNRRQA